MNEQSGRTPLSGPESLLKKLEIIKELDSKNLLRGEVVLKLQEIVAFQLSGLDIVKIEVFDVFLCHRNEDKSDVKNIGNQLKIRGIIPWFDEWELRPGLPWQRVLEEQIEQIKTAAVFVGKDGIGPWQQLELEAFLREFVNRGCPVIPVLLPEAPEEPQLPRFLKGMTWVDFRKLDPDPIERLIWGITGKRS